jgi:hypothetical protein
MSATTTVAGSFGCVCGQTFANQLSLKHHRWVTKHESIDTAPHLPVEVVVEEEETEELDEIDETECDYQSALEILRVGRESLEDYDRRLAAGPPVSQVLVNWALDSATEVIEASGRVSKQAVAVSLSFSHEVVNKLLLMLLLMLMTVSLVTVGVHLGTMVAGNGVASSPSVVTLASI